MFLVLLLLIISVIYLLNYYALTYWKRRNIPQVSGAQFLLGNAGKVFKGTKSIGELFQSIYEKYKHEKIVGAYLSYRPVIVVNDPDLIQDIMIKNFLSFHDRSLPVNEKADPLSGNLSFIRGQKWRDLRVKLSPTFTSGKLKSMFPIMKDCGIVLDEYINKNLRKGQDVFEFRDLSARFITTIISSVIFGNDNDSINDPNNLFRQMGLKMFDVSFMRTMKNITAFLIPDFYTKFNIPLVPRDIYEFIETLVSQTIKYREENQYRRYDLMQSLMELKNQGYMSVDKNSTDEDELKSFKELKKDQANMHKKLSMEEIYAQVFLFFAAGFETSSLTIYFCLFELCRNLETQKKIQDEIDRVMANAGPDGITYDLLAEMKYIDCCMFETLRKYPIVPIHFREATKDYKVPGTDIIIEKGTAIQIPILGIQRDPEIYENPLQFIPERFLNSPTGNPKKTSGLVYTPFGDGPR